MIMALIAAAIAFGFAVMLAKEFVVRRRPYTALWALALLLYGIASLVVVIGAVGGWTKLEYEIYWALGAVLTVPLLAAGEVVLLFRDRVVLWVTVLLLVFIAAYTVAVLGHAVYDPIALAKRLPSGKDVFGDGTPAHRLPQIVSIPAYTVLIVGTLWSAWKMRGRPELRERFLGTLLIAFGATIVAVGGSAFAAAGDLFLFALMLSIGVTVMFVGFLRASRQRKPLPAPVQTS